MTFNSKSKFIKDTFNTVSGSYDSEPLRFFVNSAKHLTGLLNLSGTENVLDVATGTGNVALRVARCVPEGTVTGIDFSSGMLDQARKKAEEQNIQNVIFFEQDMCSMSQNAGQGDTINSRDSIACGSEYDMATCSFGIFFADDMDAQIRAIADNVKTGGKIAITGFQENYFQPLSSMMFDRLADYGVDNPPLPWKRIANEHGCRDFLQQAGLCNIRIELANMGYFLKDETEWWDIIWNAGFRRHISSLSPDKASIFKDDHLREIATLKTKDGIWLDVGVIFAIADKN
jgi:ubiquinone/menaquinone biosynthesis C-methylase UbiE